MIGNDVVDLKLAASESNWQRPGFLRKIFVESEQELIMKSENPFNTVWILWTMKESAYKIWNRNNGIRLYNPKRFECEIASQSISKATGSVKINENIYYTRSKISPDLIETIAAQSTGLLFKAFEPESGDEIFKSNGLPYLIKNGIIVPVSVSHHGRFTRTVSIN